MENNVENKVENNKNQSQIAGAILIVGIMIAGAILLRGNMGNSVVNNNDNTNTVKETTVTIKPITKDDHILGN